MADHAPLLPGLSPVGGKPVQLTFDGGRLTSDAGVLVLAEVERRLGLAERLARCIEDPRAPERVRHGLAEMIRFRALMIAAGYADANDCEALRADPAFKMAVGRQPEGGEDLCSQPTMCRLENLPGPTALKRMMAAMVELFCDSFAQVPLSDRFGYRPSRRCRLPGCARTSSSPRPGRNGYRRAPRYRPWASGPGWPAPGGAARAPPRHDTEDRVHGNQQLALFHAHYR